MHRPLDALLVASIVIFVVRYFYEQKEPEVIDHFRQAIRGIEFNLLVVGLSKEFIEVLRSYIVFKLFLGVDVQFGNYH